MRVHWFSPLPPAKTGIADYTAQLLPALSKHAEITLWTDQETWEGALEDYASVCQYDPAHLPWVDLNRGHVSLYHIGNNPLFHGAIWQVSRHHRGIVVLHDLRLQNFFAGLYRDQWHDRDGYVREMGRYYGQHGRQDAEAFWDGHLTVEYLREHYPLTALAVDNALGVIVHAEDDLEEIAQSSSGPVVQAPLPYPAASPARQQPWAGFPARAQGPPYRLIVFGFIHTNRRLDAFLRALATMPERHHFRLHIYGELWDEGLVRSQIRHLGLDDLVSVHGFVSEAELQTALRTSHLAVNLRYPTMGEASVSQLQIWEQALPTLVTAAGWYASLPPEAVAFVRPTHEIDDIQAHLQAFLADPQRFACMGGHGRRLLEERHSPEAYVATLVELADEVAAYRPMAAWHQLLNRLQEEVNVWGIPFNSHREVLGWSPRDRIEPRQHPSVRRLKGLSRSQMTTVLAIEEAVAGQLTRLERQQEATLSAIRHAIAGQVDRQGDPRVMEDERRGAQDERRGE